MPVAEARDGRAARRLDAPAASGRFVTPEIPIYTVDSYKSRASCGAMAGVFGKPAT